jgi:antitoxin component YwqK of YwqJK toxin-antitoxin module
MSSKKSAPQAYTEYHKDGSIWARGEMLNGLSTGYWEWFRKDGTKMRSGTFLDGEQVGEWITYDQQGHVYKITRKKPKAKP